MKKTTPHLVKFKRLKQRLKLAQFQAIGLLESLWLMTTENAPQGDIGKLTNEEICIGLEWDGDPEKLISELVACRWLDECQNHRLVVHDWYEEGPSWLLGNLKRTGKSPYIATPPDYSENTAVINCESESREEKSRVEKSIRSSIEVNLSVDQGAKPDRFEEFWELFPRVRRGSKKVTNQKWQSVIQSHDPEVIISHVRGYANSADVLRGVAQMASTYLNQETFLRPLSEFNQSVRKEEPEYVQSYRRWSGAVDAVEREAEADYESDHQALLEFRETNGSGADGHLDGGS